MAYIEERRAVRRKDGFRAPGAVTERVNETLQRVTGAFDERLAGLSIGSRFRSIAKVRRPVPRGMKVGRGRSGLRRRALLLQGPVGPFFADLRRALHRSGVDTRQIAFNAADLAFAEPFGTHGFRGRERVWRRWLRGCIDAWQPDVIVLFGCERVRHSIARKLARERGIPVLSLEEGYVRPGYVTAEWGGNNRRSPLATMDADEIERLATADLPQPAAPSSFGRMAWFSFLYYVARSFGTAVFPHAIHHKRRPLLPETACWLRSVARKVARMRRNRRIIDWLLEHRRDDFVVVPLQVRDDMQLEKAGRGWTNESVIEAVTASFARHAPASRTLVFKVHPLERGHCDTLERVKHVAARHGVADRVVAIDDGSIGLVVSAAAGMITINSTSAFSALMRGVPLAVLGDAMFRRPELAWCVETSDDLDRFWTEGRVADPDTANMFRHAMTASALLPGDFYLRGGRGIAAEAIADRVVERLELEDAHLTALSAQAARGVEPIPVEPRTDAEAGPVPVRAAA